MKVLIADYMGYGDDAGKPVGHVLKVLRESAALLPKDTKIEYCVTSNYAEFLPDVQATLPYHIVVGKADTTVSNIKRMLGSFRNIRKILKCDADIIWFANVDQFLYMYLSLCRKLSEKAKRGLYGPKKGKEIMITTFATAYPKAYHNDALNEVLPTAKLVITTNPEAKLADNMLYMPDYFYRAEVYGDYNVVSSRYGAVCLGTMNQAKKIKELVETFAKLHYPLAIKGFFYDKEYLKEVIELLNNYPEEVRKLITIEDGYLTYEDYLKTLGSARFAVLPYDVNTYQNNTSGVILESIFVGTIPVTGQFLLDKMGIKGLDLASLTKESLEDEDLIAELSGANEELVKSRYDAILYADKIREALK